MSSSDKKSPQRSWSRLTAMARPVSVGRRRHTMWLGVGQMGKSDALGRDSGVSTHAIGRVPRAALPLLAALLAVSLALAARADAFVYWTNPGTNLESGTIGRANLDGTGVDESFIPIPGRHPIGVGGVAVNDTHIYWATRDPDLIGRANL